MPDSAATYVCLGCGAERPDTELTRARFSTPLGQTFIRVCPTPECAGAGAKALAADVGTPVRVLEVISP